MPAAGEKIDNRYVVRSTLGEGGMGTVLRVVDELTDFEFALKMMLPEAAADPALRDRFVQEAKAVLPLDSRHIVRINTVGLVADERGTQVPYIVMELLQGRDLERLLRRLPMRRMDPADALRLLSQACSGLAVAHDRDIIHRDLKPGNLFVDESSGSKLLKILDFGIAKVRVPAGDSRLTRANQLLGTPPYMSPEQWRGEELGPPSDLWALGVILYEVLCGQPPFGGPRDDPAELRRRILNDTPAPLSDFRPGLPEAVQRTIDRCLRREAKDRFQSAKELERELECALDDLALAATLPDVSLDDALHGEDGPDSQAGTELDVPASGRAETVAASPPPRGWTFHTQDDLLHALAFRYSRGRTVTLVVGAGLHQPHVPGARDMIDLVRAEYGENQERVTDTIATHPENPYQAAFAQLSLDHGQDAANELVRDAVLRARAELDETSRSKLRRNADGCAALEDDLKGWQLTEGAIALGRLVCDHPKFFSGGLLTSNFDPLIEVSLKNAGASFTRCVEDGDDRIDFDPRTFTVVHFHGDWISSDTLHTKTQLNQPRPKLAASLRELLRAETIVVIGYGGWKDVFTDTLDLVVESEEGNPDIVWTFHSDDEAEIRSQHAALLARLEPLRRRNRVRLFKGIDANRILPALLGRLAKEPAAKQRLESAKTVQAGAVPAETNGRPRATDRLQLVVGLVVLLLGFASVGVAYAFDTVLEARLMPPVALALAAALLLRIDAASAAVQGTVLSKLKVQYSGPPAVFVGTLALLFSVPAQVHMTQHVVVEGADQTCSDLSGILVDAEGLPKPAGRVSLFKCQASIQVPQDVFNGKPGARIRLSDSGYRLVHPDKSYYFDTIPWHLKVERVQPEPVEPPPRPFIHHVRLNAAECPSAGTVFVRTAKEGRVIEFATVSGPSCVYALPIRGEYLRASSVVSYEGEGYDQVSQTVTLDGGTTTLNVSLSERDLAVKLTGLRECPDDLELEVADASITGGFDRFDESTGCDFKTQIPVSWQQVKLKLAHRTVKLKEPKKTYPSDSEGPIEVSVRPSSVGGGGTGIQSSGTTKWSFAYCEVAAGGRPTPIGRRRFDTKEQCLAKLADYQGAKWKTSSCRLGRAKKPQQCQSGS